ncbi:hypothetical protein [Pseudoxanthomonas sp. X-1]|uniref:hypothetical protein n=1 Tax=Pseudoxanthomonas sp. X-1 TaxID=2571115 RepID=UPI001486AADC|nr:hypothetical protein [Pseudoxanthomonas sp. X-1]
MGEHSASANIENALEGLAEYTAVQTLAINRAQASGAGRKAAGRRPRPASPGRASMRSLCSARCVLPHAAATLRVPARFATRDPM